MSQDTVSENASGRQLKKQVDLTEGSPGKSLLMFAFPMILGNLFQQFYNMADSMIVGMINTPGDFRLVRKRSRELVSSLTESCMYVLVSPP